MVIYSQLYIVTKEENDYPAFFWEDEETGDEIYIGPKVVIINLGDV